MSESVYIEPARIPRYDEVLAQLNELSGLQVTSSTEVTLDQDGLWPEASLQFYRHGISTRPVEVHFLQGRFQVRTLALTAPEDFALSTRIINVLATTSRGVTKTENGEVMSRLDETTMDQVGRRMFATDAEAAAAQIEVRGAKEVGISGPVQDFYLGPRTLKELRSSGDFAERLLTAMRRLQYIDRT